jgi:signal transduction histidine kinase
LNYIRNSSIQLTNLVNELLEVDRIERGSYKTALSTGCPIGVAREFVERFSSAYRHDGTHVRFETRSQLGVLYRFPADALRHILGNLLSNALKYGGKNITVEVETEASMLALTVTDDGDGIPKRFQQKVFKRFFRMPAHSDISGKGIGLSLVQELVERSGGSMALESAARHGTRFTIKLPIVQETEQNNETDADNDTRKLVLIVEDNPELLRFTSSLFTTEYRVITASDGAEGLKLVQHEQPDLVLSDVRVVWDAGALRACGVVVVGLLFVLDG